MYVCGSFDSGLGFRFAPLRQIAADRTDRCKSARQSRAATRVFGFSLRFRLLSAPITADGIDPIRSRHSAVNDSRYSLSRTWKRTNKRERWAPCRHEGWVSTRKGGRFFEGLGAVRPLEPSLDCYVVCGLRMSAQGASPTTPRSCCACRNGLLPGMILTSVLYVRTRAPCVSPLRLPSPTWNDACGRPQERGAWGGGRGAVGGFPDLGSTVSHNNLCICFVYAAVCSFLKATGQ